MRILITGGAGYIGTVLTEVLLSRADVTEVVCFDNLLYKQDGIFPFVNHPKFKFIYGDVRDQAKLQPLIEKSHVVIPLAAIVGFPACDRDKRLAEDINQRQLEFISSIIPWGCKLIFPNTNSGYGVGEAGTLCTEETPLNPISVYGRTKCAGEKAVLDAGGISLRLATVFGTSYRFRRDLLVNDFVFRALNDKFVTLFECNFKRNFIHIRDVVSAFVHCIDNYEKMKGQAYNVGLSSANLSKLELCQKIKEKIPGFVITASEINSDPDKRDYIVSNTKIEATGWSPVYSLEDGIEELIKGYSILNHGEKITGYTNL